MPLPMSTISYLNMKHLCVAFLLCHYACAATKYNDINPKESTRIVGGLQTTTEQFPYMAQMLLDTWNDNRHVQICAATVLTVRHLLSAAHCYQFGGNGFNNSDPKHWKALVGSRYMDIDEIINHQGFDSYTYRNDIAVLVMSQDLQLSDGFGQAIISQSGVDVEAGSECTILGWGATHTSGPQSEQLIKAKVQIIDQTICNQRYSSAAVTIYNSMLCAGVLDSGAADGCYGDSGGPLLHNGVVIGIISFGRLCGHYFYPGVYTRVSVFTEWIVEAVNRNKFRHVLT